jgi:ABC-type xylose transport system permease subunit
MSKHKGLRLSVIGGLIFIISLIMLAFISWEIPSVVMIVGGVLVWGGLVWTLFGYYSADEPRTHP